MPAPRPTPKAPSCSPLSSEGPDKSVRVANPEASSNPKPVSGTSPDPESIINAFDGWLYICSPDYHIEFINQQLIHHIGYDATGQRCHQAIFNRKTACPWCVMSRIIKGEIVRHEMKSPMDKRWYYMINTPLYRLDGTVLNQAMLMDITARIKAEEKMKSRRDQLENLVKRRTARLIQANSKLRQEIKERNSIEKAIRDSEERLRTIFEGSRDAIFISNAKGQIMDVNTAAESVTGYSKSQLKKMRVQDINISANTNEYKRFFQRIISGEDITSEAVIQKQNKQKIETEFSSTRIMFGNKSCLHTVARDITHRKSAEQALRRSEAKYRELVENANSIILRFDTEGRITFFNEYAQRFFGYDEGEIIGRHVLKTIVPQTDSTGQDLEKKFKKLLNKPDAYTNMEIETIRRDGERLWVTWTSRAILNKKGSVQELLMVGMDNTERKQANERIQSLTHQLIKVQENERLKISRDLHDNVAQDLSSLKIGMATLFDEQPAVSTATRRKLDYLTNTLLRTISSVRDIAYNLRPPGLDQLGLVRTIFLYCEEFSQFSGLKIDFNAAGVNELNLDFDTEINLYRLIQEALRNTQKHASASEVTLHLVASHPNILLRIKDNGIGFNVRSRRIKSLKERRMGLQSMEERVGLLNGKIRIDSRKNQGTVISIEIPVKDKRNGVTKKSADH